MSDMFLGKPTDYWLELDARARQMNCAELIAENAALKRKLLKYQAALYRVGECIANELSTVTKGGQNGNTR